MDKIYITKQENANNNKNDLIVTFLCHNII